LIIIIADHDEYKKLNNTNIGKSVLYDGRGIIIPENLEGAQYSMIGNLN
jgi:UDP-N-acetyl-D-mannosaminuronate dehydrogenase